MLEEEEDERNDAVCAVVKDTVLDGLSPTFYVSSVLVLVTIGDMAGEPGEISAEVFLDGNAMEMYASADLWTSVFRREFK